MAPAAPSSPGNYDPALRRQSVREGREKGCWVYIAQAELLRAGFRPGDPAPQYRVWGRARGGVLVRLYKRAVDEVLTPAANATRNQTGTKGRGGNGG